MRRLLTLTLAVAVAALALTPLAWAADIEGKIKSVDPTGRVLTLEDGTSLMIPATMKVDRKDLKPGADVKASYEDKGGAKVVTSIEVHPAPTQK